MKARKILQQFRAAKTLHGGRDALLKAMLQPLAFQQPVEDLYYTDEGGYFEYCYRCGKPYTDHIRKKLPRKQRDDYRLVFGDSPECDFLPYCEICSVTLTCHIVAIEESLECFTWLPGRSKISGSEMAYIFIQIMECVAWNAEEREEYEPVADRVALHTFAGLDEEARLKLTKEQLCQA